MFSDIEKSLLPHRVMDSAVSKVRLFPVTILGDSLKRFVSSSPLRLCLCALGLLLLYVLLGISSTRRCVCVERKYIKVIRGCVRYLLGRILPTRKQPQVLCRSRSRFEVTEGLGA